MTLPITFDVVVAFTSEDEEYGTETYRRIAAPNQKTAVETAMRMSEDSRYADPRIDYVRRVSSCRRSPQ